MIPTLISDITDQPGVITKRDNTRSLLPRPVNCVAFAKENPSGIGSRNLKNQLLLRLCLVCVHYTKQPLNKENPSGIGSGNSKNRLLPRLRPVRVHYAYQYPVRPLYWAPVHLAASAAPLPTLRPTPRPYTTTLHHDPILWPTLVNYVWHRNLTSKLGQRDYPNQ